MWVITFVVNPVDGLCFDLTFLDDVDQWRNDTLVDDQNTQSQAHNNRFDHLLASIEDSLALGNLNVLTYSKNKVADCELRSHSIKSQRFFENVLVTVLHESQSIVTRLS